MNAYDFDKTIFMPDSSYSFVRYCMRHYPRAVLKTLRPTALTALLYFMKKADTKQMKEKVFAFLPALDNVEQIVLDFWEEYRDHLQDWYLRQKQPDDVILSASPEFLLAPICEELGVRLIGTPMDPYTGKIRGLNCHDEEKLRRFYREYPEGHIERFYSDSRSDEPLAKIADQAFLVGKDVIQPWPDL